MLYVPIPAGKPLVSPVPVQLSVVNHWLTKALSFVTKTTCYWLSDV